MDHVIKIITSLPIIKQKAFWKDAKIAIGDETPASTVENYKLVLKPVESYLRLMEHFVVDTTLLEKDSISKYSQRLAVDKVTLQEVNVAAVKLNALVAYINTAIEKLEVKLEPVDENKFEQEQQPSIEFDEEDLSPLFEAAEDEERHIEEIEIEGAPKAPVSVTVDVPADALRRPVEAVTREMLLEPNTAKRKAAFAVMRKHPRKTQATRVMPGRQPIEEK